MNLEKEIELFERWCVKDDEFCIHRYAGSDDYSDDYTQCAWLAWLASASREGYKLVPVDINENIESAMFSSVAKGDMPRDIYKAMIGAVE